MEALFIHYFDCIALRRPWRIREVKPFHKDDFPKEAAAKFAYRPEVIH
jgi:hypothetical protein